jgi:AcrR family transcriptional regulator
VQDVTLCDVDTRSLTREQRKQRTRRALLHSALGLLEEQSFSGLSLREVTREAGVVPTAFYRHFTSMDELGLVLIDESFRTLREMLRAARGEAAAPEHVIRRSVEILVHHVNANRAHFRFIARERFSGATALRHTIRGEIRLIASELATDLARLPGTEGWSTEDLQMLAGLLVNAMVSTVEAILDAPAGSEDDVIRVAEKQLRLVALGVPHWRSGPRPVRLSR